MAEVTEVNSIDSTNFVGVFKILHIRWAKKTLEDNEVVSTIYHRETYAPGSDLKHLPQEVQDACGEVHTQELIDAYVKSVTPKPLTEEEEKERARQEAQKRRDDALSNMTHTWADGSVVQVRPKDQPQFQSAIQIGMDQRWVLLDNTTRLTTVAEMQEALNYGLAQGKAIWDQYVLELEAL